MDTQESQERLERKRKDALERRDAFTYTRLCEVLGIEKDSIEAPELCDLANAEHIYSNPKRRDSLGRNKKYKYIKFLEEAEKLTVKDHFMSIGQKKELLVGYFPRRFGVGRKQDLDNYSGKEIGALFHSIVESYRKIIRRL